MKRNLRINVNGDWREVSIEPNLRLLDLLRDELLLTGAKEGCGTGDCGACSVILDGKLVTSCCVLALSANGRSVQTVEGIATDGLHPVQQAFMDWGGLQCGICTPGMIVAAKVLLDENPNPTEEEIRVAIAGNLCRCTGYAKIIDAIHAASRMLSEQPVAV